MAISVRSGDIAAVEADALITAINSGGTWFGGIDRVIVRRSGGHFHNEAASRILVDGDAFLVAGPPAPGSFRNVVFVVDDLKRPLQDIVLAGLRAAASAGCETVSLPAIRMGVMQGVVERSKEEAAASLVAGVNDFTREADRELDVTIVVYNDPEAVAQFRKLIA